MPRNSAAKRRSDENRNENDFFDGDDSEDDAMNETATQKTMMFTSQQPEMTQEILQVKDSERMKLMEMTANQREKAIRDLSRLVLFKALAGDSIDRSKCLKEAGISSDVRVSSALFDEVNVRLQNCFGFEVKRIPAWMEKIKGVSKSQKDRYYVTNGLHEADGSHSRALHMVHEQSSIEKGLLMIVLAFVYCKGESRNDGSRWIHDKDLYTLLHRLDENIPPEPPAVHSKRSKSATASLTQGTSRFVGGVGAAQTPDVDALLCKFCHRDYLIKEKASDHQQQGGSAVEDDSFFYAMGPRAAIEIGRRQVIYFCAEILDETPDPTMLQELEVVTEDAAMD